MHAGVRDFESQTAVREVLSGREGVSAMRAVVWDQVRGAPRKKDVVGWMVSMWACR